MYTSTCIDKRLTYMYYTHMYIFYSIVGIIEKQFYYCSEVQVHIQAISEG